MTSARWPWPADAPRDRLMRVANSYRAELERLAPEACAQLDEVFLSYGETWVKPVVQRVELEDLLPTADAAHLAGVTVDVVRQWARRGLLPKHTAPDGSPRYLVADLIELQASRRRRRAERAAPR